VCRFAVTAHGVCLLPWKNRMTHSPAASLDICSFGSAHADLSAISGMRKRLPDWVAEGTPGHFLKHSDEQTVVAVAAIDRAIQSQRLNVQEQRDWAIIAAPRFVGRLAGAATLERFARGGGPAISPHLIPQHSLHSISGALSILLASRGPNLGVGGGADSLAEGLLAALALPQPEQTAGTWLICTAWEPEPIIDRQGCCTNAPVCSAVALALKAAAGQQTCGRLTLAADPCGAELHMDAAERQRATVAELGEAGRALTCGGPACHFCWRLRFGASLILDMYPPAARLRLAA
jgi:hypothetical protein